MTRQLLSNIFTALAILLALAVSSSAGGPIGMPGTLISMYAESDVIVTAQYDRTERGEMIREDEDFRVTAVKQYFDVTSVLKGSAVDRVMLTDEEFRAPGSQLVPAPAPDDLKTGDTVLLFLRKNQSGDLELTEFGEGLKKLSARDIAVYEKRIAELASLFSGGRADPEDVTEWLVRCAEDPATRWDASFELIKSMERVDWQRKQAEKNKEEAPAEKLSVRKYALSAIAGDTALLAKAITLNQKQALANILFNQIYLPREEQTGRVRGDRELIEIVKRWGDTRLTRLLLDELRNTPASAYRAAESINLVAELVDDPCVRRLAANYNAITDENSRTAAIREFVIHAEKASSN